jgi:hypothetical protein
MKVGDLVRWKNTGEMGIVVELHKLSYLVCWFESGRPACAYNIDDVGIEVTSSLIWCAGSKAVAPHALITSTMWA